MRGAGTNLWRGRVVLVNPPFAMSDSYHLSPPLGLLAVARELRNLGVDDIQLADLALALAEGELSAGESLPRLAAQGLASHRADVYGFSVQCFNLPVAVGVALALHRLCPDAQIVFGGHHATLSGPSLSKRFPFIAEVVEGPLSGERGKAESGWLNPDYSVAPPLARYKAVSRHAVGLVQTGVGCPYSCSFCSVPIVHGNRVSHKAVEQVMGEIHMLRTRGMDIVSFVDDTFTINRAYLAKLLSALSASRRTRWTCMTRADQVTRELLARMGEAGCENVLYGIESASSEMLGKLSKRLHHNTDLVEVLQWNLDADISPTFYFLINCPEDTLIATGMTLELAARLSVLDPGCCVLQLPRIAPGTAMWKQVSGRLIPAPGTPYAEILRQTLDEGVESAWGMINRHRDIFSSYCAAPGPIPMSTANAIAWFGTQLLGDYPLTMAGMAEHGALLGTFNAIAEARGRAPWWELDEETVVASVRRSVQREAPNLLGAFYFETWQRRISKNIVNRADRFHESRVDTVGAKAAIRSGRSIAPNLYGKRRMYKATEDRVSLDGQQNHKELRLGYP